MRTQDLLRAQYRNAHDIIEQVIDDCDPETLAKVVGWQRRHDLSYLRTRRLR